MILRNLPLRLPLAVGLCVAGLVAGCSTDPGGTAAPPPTLVVQAPDCSGGLILKPTSYELEALVEGEVTSVRFEISGPSGTAEATATLGEDGLARGTYTFERQGSYSIAVAATTALNTYTSDPPMVCAVVNAAPTVRIIDPLNASTFDEEATLVLKTQVTDDDDDPTDLTVTWESARDGELGSSNAGADGFAILEYTGLSVFNHLLTARVSDPWGSTADATVTVEIVECEDRDGDGVSECSDCEDRDPEVYPGAVEVCDGKDNDCNGEIDELGDADGDGYTRCVSGCAEGGACILDCDDDSAQVHPGVLEVCDTVDNNCDGTIDEGYDLDGDGYSSCTAQIDCDDGNPNANPGLTETCDRVDQDCDGSVDEGLTETWYQDSDRDGYGDPDAAFDVCPPAIPPGLVDNADDCDDSRATVFPGNPEACDGLDNNCDGTIDEGQPQNTYYADLDLDGYGDGANVVMACVRPEAAQENQDDCDDTNVGINPAAIEVCDGVDQNCNGEVDEGVTTPFYADGDGDGYGAAADTVSACTAPIGYVAQAGDCAPADANTFPGAAELCDVADNDCDTKVDEGAAETFYYDGDEDGYGDDGNTQVTCSPDAGYIRQGGDCDDTRPLINPAGTETCNGRDQDCDGLTDEGVKNTYYEDADGDGYGDTGTIAKACTVPEGYSPASGDCDDDTADSFPGATELCDGKDNDCNGELDNGLTARPFYLDSDGDGYGDESQVMEACASPVGYAATGGDCRDANPDINPGAADVCNSKDDDCDDEIDEHVKITYYKDVDRDGYGSTEERLACFQCDGCALNDDDCDDEDPQVYPGAPELFDGADNDCDGQLEREMTVLSAPASFSGMEAGAYTGAAVAAIGDIDGDQIADMAFSAPRYSNRRGAVYVVYGKAAGWGHVAASNADVTMTSAMTDVEAGTSITGGDVDNDGVSDLLIGIPQYNSIGGQWAQGGHVALFYGGGRLASGDIVSAESNRVEGYFPQVHMGYDLAAGDVTCDGIDDVIIAAPWSWTAQYPSPGGGAVFILPGKNSRYMGLGGVGGSELIQMYGANNDMLGQAVAFVGNAGGSSCNDFIANADGKTGQGPQAKEDIGRTYLVAGGGSEQLPLSEFLEVPDLDIATWDGTDASDRVGASLDGLGDVNGDSLPDFILGREQSTAGEPMGLMFFGGGSLPGSGSAEGLANVGIISNAGLRCPCKVAGLGDVNADGLNDFAVAVPGASSGGTIFIFFGKEQTWPRTITAEVYADVIITAEQPGDDAGYAVSGVGDVNDDGADDFAIGARGADGEVDGSGMVYLFFGYHGM